MTQTYLRKVMQAKFEQTKMRFQWMNGEKKEEK